MAGAAVIIPSATMDSAGISKSRPVRVVTVDTLRSDITAKELAQLMALEVTFTKDWLDAATPEQRALVERNSKPT